MLIVAKEICSENLGVHLATAGDGVAGLAEVSVQNDGEAKVEMGVLKAAGCQVLGEGVEDLEERARAAANRSL